MAKTLKQMLEVYKPKAADEQKFVDKHVTVKHDDANGNKDDVFQGTNVKKVDRKKERHGYEAGEDEKVYESIEDFTLEEIEEFMQTEEYAQLDELSKTTLGKYIRKAAADVGHRSVAASQSAHHALDARERAKNPKLAFAKSGNLTIAKMHANKMDTHISKTVSRKEGIAKAVSRLTKESVDVQIDEKMAPGADAGKYIKDFEQSDAPQFKGKSKAKRRQMAIAAYMSQKNEGVEHIDENSKKPSKHELADEQIAKHGGDHVKAADATYKIANLMRSSQWLHVADEIQRRIDSKKKSVKEEVEQINEGEEAHAQFTKYHSDTAGLLKKIHSGLSKHYDNITNKKSYNKGVAGWHNVDTIKDVHRTLQDLHDRILQNVEYSTPIKPVKEDVDVSLLNLYLNLDEDNRVSMMKMLDEGRKEELVEFTKTLEAE